MTLDREHGRQIAALFHHNPHSSCTQTGSSGDSDREAACTSRLLAPLSVEWGSQTGSAGQREPSAAAYRSAGGRPLAACQTARNRTMSPAGS
jgi:hypothetical protein